MYNQCCNCILKFVISTNFPHSVEEFKYLIWFLSSMHSFMVHSLLISHEFSITIIAVISSISSMSSFMLISNVFSTKCFATYCTQEGSSLTVGVTFKGVSSGKSHTTFFTFKRTNSGMNDTFVKSHRSPP